MSAKEFKPTASYEDPSSDYYVTIGNQEKQLVAGGCWFCNECWRINKYDGKDDKKLACRYCKFEPDLNNTTIMTQQRVKEMKAKQALMQWKCSGCESVRLNRKRQTSCRICHKKKTGADRVGWPCQFKSKFT